MSASLGLKLIPPGAAPADEAMGASLTELYEAHASLVFRGLRRLGVPHASLEDAVQDVFLVVHRRAQHFEARAAVTTFIYGIVVRVAKDYRRAARRHTNRLERAAELLAFEPPRASCPAEATERRQANELLHRLLSTLEDELREVLVLVELEELPMREAALALGLHVRACQRRLQKARAAFNTALAKLEPLQSSIR